MRILRTVFWGLLVAFCTAGADRITVTLLATTDLHGNIYPYDYFTAAPANRGLAKIATLVEQVRRENPNVLLIDCGDTIQGTPLESVYQHFISTGRFPLGLKPSGALAADPMMLAMNRLGYEAMVVGNHEFNFGLKNLERARADARFPWISANIVVEPGAGVKPFDPYIVKSVAGAKVAVIGITTPSIPSWEKPENYRGLRFLPGVQAVRAAVDQLRRRERPDLIIAAVHAGLGEGRENMVTAVAKRVAGIQAIVYGHSHQREPGRRVGVVLLVQPQHWGASLARLDFELERRGVAWQVVDCRSRLLAVGKETPADAAILELARPYHDLAERYLTAPVAEAPVALDAALGRFEDNALVDAIHAVQLHYAKADVSFTALFNTGVRISAGPVSVRQIAALYPYDNELYAIEGNGRMVKEALENAARYFLSCRDPACSAGPLINRAVMGYNYDMAQGVEYEIDLTQPPGRRIRNLRFRGRPLEPNQKLRIAINNYRAAGSGGYGMFKNARILWRSGEDLRNLVVAYFIERGRLPDRPDGNWRIVPAGALKTLAAEAGRAQ